MKKAFAIIIVLSIVISLVFYKFGILSIGVSNVIATIALAFFVAISNQSIESIKHGQNKEIQQYTLSNQVYIDFIKNYYTAVEFMNKLTKKYQSSDFNRWSLDEMAEYNKFVTNFNVTLAQMYVGLADEGYEKLLAGFEIGERTFKDYGESLLVAMRKNNYMDTRFDTREDIRLLFYR